ncbi:hypothetical protein THOM_1267 [Trachipleistophora hominis]|uniref:Uncharacterized protein n=1 Tax=Trachipleistophora hominis TaxID=72359 RepID=L7JXM8_TRAHO|nr:hypothetical protein THOM_1267 [Trachipleistophora hominis]
MVANVTNKNKKEISDDEDNELKTNELKDEKEGMKTPNNDEKSDNKEKNELEKEKALLTAKDEKVERQNNSMLVNEDIGKGDSSSSKVEDKKGIESDSSKVEDKKGTESDSSKVEKKSDSINNEVNENISSNKAHKENEKKKNNVNRKNDNAINFIDTSAVGSEDNNIGPTSDIIHNGAKNANKYILGASADHMKPKDKWNMIINEQNGSSDGKRKNKNGKEQSLKDSKRNLNN